MTSSVVFQRMALVVTSAAHKETFRVDANISRVDGTATDLAASFPPHLGLEFHHEGMIDSLRIKLGIRAALKMRTSKGLIHGQLATVSDVMTAILLLAIMVLMVVVVVVEVFLCFLSSFPLLLLLFLFTVAATATVGLCTTSGSPSPSSAAGCAPRLRPTRASREGRWSADGPLFLTNAGSVLFRPTHESTTRAKGLF